MIEEMTSNKLYESLTKRVQYGTWPERGFRFIGRKLGEMRGWVWVLSLFIALVGTLVTFGFLFSYSWAAYAYDAPYLTKQIRSLLVTFSTLSIAITGTLGYVTSRRIFIRKDEELVRLREQLKEQRKCINKKNKLEKKNKNLDYKKAKPEIAEDTKNKIDKKIGEIKEEQLNAEETVRRIDGDISRIFSKLEAKLKEEIDEDLLTESKLADFKDRVKYAKNAKKRSEKNVFELTGERPSAPEPVVKAEAKSVVKDSQKPKPPSRK